MSTTISSKLAALAAALLINGFIMGAVGYMFEIQIHSCCAAHAAAAM
jgi:hypothetical protein